MSNRPNILIKPWKWHLKQSTKVHGCAHSMKVLQSWRKASTASAIGSGYQLANIERQVEIWLQKYLGPMGPKVLLKIIFGQESSHICLSIGVKYNWLWSSLLHTAWDRCTIVDTTAINPSPIVLTKGFCPTYFVYTLALSGFTSTACRKASNLTFAAINSSALTWRLLSS